jgi:hypothetical protein
MNKKTIIKNIAIAVVTVIAMLGIIFGFSAIVTPEIQKDTMKDNLSSFVETPLEKNENLRLEIVLPVGKTLDSKGTIFADENGEMWILDNFYAEKNEVFIALLTDKGTTEKTDDVIVDIWLDL